MQRRLDLGVVAVKRLLMRVLQVKHGRLRLLLQLLSQRRWRQVTV